MTSAYRTLATEIRLHPGTAATSLGLCAVTLLVTVLLSDAMVSVLPLWASLAWYRYGRQDTPAREELRASLGLSRADRVRGRVVLIAAETALLLVTAAACMLIAHALDRATVGASPTVTVAGPPGAPVALLVLVGSLYSAAALLVVASVVGGECVTRVPGGGLILISLGVHLGAGLLGAAVVGVPLATLQIGSATGTVVATAGVLLLAMLLLSLLLRRRLRGWIRQLDAGAATRRRVEA
ncbi:hypothetical protein ACT3SP_11765 [Brachybacterium sp. AOP43-C2-M15]|uniref:hypothetical protein n=1 Tax=Brachybacterium sp. AOP43-C2-M15 TaxID=3457661 RepID=UPI0040343B8D